ncbi:MAG: amino acid adenylation domain-containing protein [Acidobacteriia bacterium]|nr:amino acid adenylation domain-containing protein [Terriglobia bacterium]
MTPALAIDRYPVSPLQHGMLFQHLTAPQSGVDIEQMVCTLRETLEPSLLRRAWEHVVSRHPVLRTAFQFQADGDPVQIVSREVALPWQEHDWRTVPPDLRADRLAAFLSEDRHRGFNMSEAPLLRLTLVRVEEAEYRLVWTFHHALLDGRSFPLVLQEVFALYESSLTGQELDLPRPRPYRDYIEWLQSQDPSSAEAYWRRQLRGFSVATPLVVDKPSGAHSPALDRQGDDSVVLSAAATTALNELARGNGVTLNTVVQGAWALLLSRYSGEEDVAYGVVRACRKSSVDGADDMVGLFINTLPMRVRVPSEAKLADWLKELRCQWLAMRDYEHTPLVAAQKCADVAPGKPLFESIVMFENYDLNERLRQQGGKWADRSFRLYEQTGYPLTVTVYAHDELRLQIEFDRCRFEPAAIARMLGHLKTLLEGMVAGSGERLAFLPLLTQQERRQLLLDWNDTSREYPPEALLHRLFEAQVERSPDAVAVTFEDREMSYRELNARANQLARYLRRCGVGPNVLVCVCAERSLDMVVALYGILKAGGAYVPLDPDYPEERLAFMLEDAGAPILLTQTRLLHRLPSHSGKAICLDGDWGQIAIESPGNLDGTTTPDDLAYMIYTSGSTGRPKGAMNTHRGICNRLLWMQDEYGLTATDRVLQKTPFSFDVSVWEFFWPLLMGARLAVADPGGHRDPAYLVKLIRRQDITVLHFVPSMLAVFLDETGVEECRSLRHVICSGEALPFSLQERFYEKVPAKLQNLYGPTEAAVDVTYWSCEPRSERGIVPIGRPVANTQVYILDPRLQPVPVGVPGELHIGGVQVGRGYHRRPGLTAEKFIPDLFRDGPEARLYKTGDLCRWLEDGSIEYLGRIDFQVKIRGLRVELGEIESALRGCKGVRDAVVTANEAGGDKRLVAYVTSSGEEECTPAALRTYLARTLPDYMVPAAFVRLTEMPLSPNGKLDRKALPAPELQIESKEVWSPPENQAEQNIARVWQEVLGVGRVGRDNNFFDLGGHSLLMMRARTKLEQNFGWSLPIVEMFRFPTVRSLAKYVTAHDEEPGPLIRSRQQAEAQGNAARMRLRRTRLRVN